MAPLSSLTRADIYETGVFILAHYYGRNILSITWCQPRGLTLDTSTKRRPDLLQVPAAALPSGNVDSNTTISEVSPPFNAH